MPLSISYGHTSFEVHPTHGQSKERCIRDDLDDWIRTSSSASWDDMDAFLCGISRPLLTPSSAPPSSHSSRGADEGPIWCTFSDGVKSRCVLHSRCIRQPSFVRVCHAGLGVIDIPLPEYSSLSDTPFERGPPVSFPCVSLYRLWTVDPGYGLLLSCSLGKGLYFCSHPLKGFESCSIQFPDSEPSLPESMNMHMMTMFPNGLFLIMLPPPKNVLTGRLVVAKFECTDILCCSSACFSTESKVTSLVDRSRAVFRVIKSFSSSSLQLLSTPFCTVPVEFVRTDVENCYCASIFESPSCRQPVAHIVFLVSKHRSLNSDDCQNASFELISKDNSMEFENVTNLLNSSRNSLPLCIFQIGYSRILLSVHCSRDERLDLSLAESWKFSLSAELLHSSSGIGNRSVCNCFSFSVSPGSLTLSDRKLLFAFRSFCRSLFRWHPSFPITSLLAANIIMNYDDFSIDHDSDIEARNREMLMLKLFCEIVSHTWKSSIDGFMDSEDVDFSIRSLSLLCQAAVIHRNMMSPQNQEALSLYARLASIWLATNLTNQTCNDSVNLLSCCLRPEICREIFSLNGLDHHEASPNLYEVDAGALLSGLLCQWISHSVGYSIEATTSPSSSKVYEALRIARSSSFCTGIFLFVDEMLSKPEFSPIIGQLFPWHMLESFETGQSLHRNLPLSNVVNHEKVSTLCLTDSIESSKNCFLSYSEFPDLRIEEISRILTCENPIQQREVLDASFGERSHATEVGGVLSESESRSARVLLPALRTISTALGRGLFRFGRGSLPSDNPLWLPKLELSIRTLSRGAFVSPAIPMEEISSWSWFHNACASSLELRYVQSQPKNGSLCPSSVEMVTNSISSAWIAQQRRVFRERAFRSMNDKSQDVSNGGVTSSSAAASGSLLDADFAFAGLVYGLGLRSQLDCLTPNDIYRLLQYQSEPLTSAILLGLSSQRLGSADPTVMKLLSIHIPALLPRSPDTDTPVLVQCAAVIGLGLVHFALENRLVTDILLAELGSRALSSLLGPSAWGPLGAAVSINSAYKNLSGSSTVISPIQTYISSPSVFVSISDQSCVLRAPTYSNLPILDVSPPYMIRSSVSRKRRFASSVISSSTLSAVFRENHSSNYTHLDLAVDENIGKEFVQSPFERSSPMRLSNSELSAAYRAASSSHTSSLFALWSSSSVGPATSAPAWAVVADSRLHLGMDFPFRIHGALYRSPPLLITPASALAAAASVVISGSLPMAAAGPSVLTGSWTASGGSSPSSITSVSLHPSVLGSDAVAPACWPEWARSHAAQEMNRFFHSISGEQLSDAVAEVNGENDSFSHSFSCPRIAAVASSDPRALASLLGLQTVSENDQPPSSVASAVAAGGTQYFTNLGVPFENGRPCSVLDGSSSYSSNLRATRVPWGRTHRIQNSSLSGGSKSSGNLHNSSTRNNQQHPLVPSSNGLVPFAGISFDLFGSQQSNTASGPAATFDQHRPGSGILSDGFDWLDTGDANSHDSVVEDDESSYIRGSQHPSGSNGGSISSSETTSESQLRTHFSPYGPYSDHRAAYALSCGIGIGFTHFGRGMISRSKDAKLVDVLHTLSTGSGEETFQFETFQHAKAVTISSEDSMLHLPSKRHNLPSRASNLSDPLISPVDPQLSPIVASSLLLLPTGSEAFLSNRLASMGQVSNVSEKDVEDRENEEDGVYECPDSLRSPDNSSSTLHPLPRLQCLRGNLADELAYESDEWSGDEEEEKESKSYSVTAHVQCRCSSWLRRSNNTFRPRLRGVWKSDSLGAHHNLSILETATCASYDTMSRSSNERKAVSFSSEPSNLLMSDFSQELDFSDEIADLSDKNVLSARDDSGPLFLDGDDGSEFVEEEAEGEDSDMFEDAYAFSASQYAEIRVRNSCDPDSPGFGFVSIQLSHDMEPCASLAALYGSGCGRGLSSRLGLFRRVRFCRARYLRRWRRNNWAYLLKDGYSPRIPSDLCALNRSLFSVAQLRLPFLFSEKIGFDPIPRSVIQSHPSSLNAQIRPSHRGRDTCSFRYRRSDLRSCATGFRHRIFGQYMDRSLRISSLVAFLEDGTVYSGLDPMRFSANVARHSAGLARASLLSVMPMFLFGFCSSSLVFRFRPLLSYERFLADYDPDCEESGFLHFSRLLSRSKSRSVSSLNLDSISNSSRSLFLPSMLNWNRWHLRSMIGKYSARSPVLLVSIDDFRYSRRVLPASLAGCTARSYISARSRPSLASRPAGFAGSSSPVIGASLALGMMFISSSSDSIANKLRLPDSLDFVLRLPWEAVFTRSLMSLLVCSHGIKPSLSWMMESIPSSLRRGVWRFFGVSDLALARFRVRQKKMSVASENPSSWSFVDQLHEYACRYLDGTAKNDEVELDMLEISTPFCLQQSSILSACSYALGFRYASCNQISAEDDTILRSTAREMLLLLLRQCVSWWTSPSSSTSSPQAADRLGTSLLLCSSALSASILLAGSCDVEIAALIRSALRAPSTPYLVHCGSVWKASHAPRAPELPLALIDPAAGFATFGVPQALHMALGFLFMSEGSARFRPFFDRDSSGCLCATSALATTLVSTLPFLAMHPVDNTMYPQYLRELYALAIDLRPSA